MLATPPESVEKILKEAEPDSSTASWAVRFAAHQEDWLVGGHGRARATECIQCGKCEEVWPQHIKIRDTLEKVRNELLA